MYKTRGQDNTEIFNCVREKLLSCVREKILSWVRKKIKFCERELLSCVRKKFKLYFCNLGHLSLDILANLTIR